MDPVHAVDMVGVQVFGRITASISHELKNCLAVIGESAGLLDDLAHMAGRGAPLDPDRLQAVLGRITRQVDKADGVIRTMNRFAHSADQAASTVELAGVLELAVRLAERKAAMARVGLRAGGGDEVRVTVALFPLVSLLFLLLVALAEQVPGQDLVMEGVHQEGRAMVMIQRLGGPGPVLEPGADIALLASSLKSEIEPSTAGCRILLPLACSRAEGYT